MNNNWGYVEDSLQIRINAHKNFAKYDIDEWIINKINLKGNERLLDLCCGNGKQSIKYAELLFGKGKVDAIEISEELLNEAKSIAESKNIRINFHCQDINNKLPFRDEHFDVVTCAFGLYYVQNVSKVLSEIFRVLKPGSKLFVVGPTVNNAREMLDIYEEITQKKLIQKWEKRMDSEIIPEIKKIFGDAEIEIFKNPLEFPSIEEFVKYISATGYFKENTEEKINGDLIKHFYDQNPDKKTLSGSFLLTKEVYGILAHKKSK